MKTVGLIESQPSVLELTEDEANALVLLGRKLASTASWWGASFTEEARSVVALARVDAKRYRVIFRDVIGVVRVGDAQFEIVPKIPLDHFLFLASKTQLAPRGSDSEVKVSSGFELVGLICQWLLSACEQLLRLGLRKGYSDLTDVLPAARGRLLVCETASDILCGQAQVTCEFDDLSFDTPLNRFVRAACEVVSGLVMLDEANRVRARRIVYRLDGIGPLQHSDRRVTVDRLTASYGKAVPLARLILDGCGASTTYGKVRGSTFLIRTPDLIEDGLRLALADALPEVGVVKRKLMLGATGISMSPDLVFSAAAVGDVKYRYFRQFWNTPDLYQVVAFATAFDAHRAGVFGFSGDSSVLPPSVPVGPIQVRPFSWLTAGSVAPQESLRRLCQEVEAWLR